MRLFTKLFCTFAVLALSAANLWAADPDLSNYTLLKSINWAECSDLTRGTDALSITAFETGNARQQVLYPLTAPEEAAGWIGVQSTNNQDGKGWWNRAEKGGLWCYNATRSAAVYGEDLKAGALVVFTANQDIDNVITLVNADGNADGAFTYQKSVDGKSYFCTITEDNGYVGFCGKKSSGYITNISVYKAPDPFTVLKSVTWGGDEDILRDADGKLDITAYETGNKKQQVLYAVTSPADAAGWLGVQLTRKQDSKGWENVAGSGLKCTSAARSAAIYGEDLTAGCQVIFTCSGDASTIMTLVNGSGEPDGPFTFVQSEDKTQYICTITAESNGYVGFCGNRDKGYITKIEVLKPNAVVTISSYTVKYVNMEGVEIKEAAEYPGVVGNEIVLSDADKANISYEGIVYVYDSDDAEGLTVADGGTTVVTVKFHEATMLNYVVNEVADGEVVRSTEGTSFETDVVKVPYRKYNVKDGKLYTKDATNKEYNYNFTLTKENQEENLAYTATSTENVVFLSEGEDIEGLTICESANTAIRSSNSSSAYAKDADVAITTLSAGTYKITAFIYDASKTPDSHWIFKAGEEQIADLNCTTVNIQELASEEFTLTENTTIYLAQGGGNTMGLDLIYIVGNGKVVDEDEPIVEPVDEDVKFSITDASGYTTYYNGKKSFIMPEGTRGGIITAVVDGNAYLEFLYPAGTVVPAGTALIINGELKDYTPVMTEEAPAVESNYLHGYDPGEAFEQYDENYYFYKLTSPVVDGVKKLGFYWFASDPHTNLTKPAKAFLQLPAGEASANGITICESTPDGIKTLDAANTNNMGVYTLSGVRVNADKLNKGVYVVNGKKIIIQ